MAFLSRRSLLTTAGLAPVAGLLGSCDPTTPPPSASPARVGGLSAGTLILGEDSGTTALAQPLTTRDIPVPVKSYNFTCVDGLIRARELPKRVLAAAYYPRLKDNERDHRVPEPNPFRVRGGPWPVLLYAHALRFQEIACAAHYPIDRDFAKVGAILRHVVSYGCVAIAPDLSWLPPDLPNGATREQAIELRAQVLIHYYRYLRTLNTTVFAGQLDLSRLMLVGHSTGGGAATLAGVRIGAETSLQAVAHGLLAPYFSDDSETFAVGGGTKNVVVIRGTEDTVPGWWAGYTTVAAPKTLVTIPGANHFGFTDLCEYNNTCEPGIGSLNGDISRTGQQQTAAAYLAAALGLYLRDDQSMRPYLSGERPVEGLDALGVIGIKVAQQGVAAPPPPVKALPR
jgi:hypothetical protein